MRLRFIILWLLALVPARATAASVTLAWDPNTEPDLGGYIVYYGPFSRVYTNAVNVGNVTTHTVTGLVWGVKYHFALTAYSTNGLESEFSEEVSWLESNSPPVLALSTNRLVVRCGTTSAPVALTFTDAESPGQVAVSVTASNLATNRLVMVLSTNLLSVRVMAPTNPVVALLTFVARDPAGASNTVRLPVFIGLPPAAPTGVRVVAALQASADLERWRDVARLSLENPSSETEFFRVRLYIEGSTDETGRND